MFKELQQINQRPGPFECYTAQEFWDDEHISQQMLGFHLDGSNDLATRNREFRERSTQWIISRFDIGKGKSVCDLGCGPGLYTTAFAEAGADVTGVDFSSRSVQYAGQVAAGKNLNIKYVLQNYLEFTSDEKFDLVTMINYDYCPLSPDQRRTLLSRVVECLKDDGVFLFDVFLLDFFKNTDESMTYEQYPQGGFWSASPHYVFNTTFKYPDEKLILGKHTVIEQNHSREIYNWLQCFDKNSIADELNECGFSVEEFFANIAGDRHQEASAEMAIVARKA